MTFKLTKIKNRRFHLTELSVFYLRLKLGLYLLSFVDCF